MVKCRRCGLENPIEHNFCPTCGNQLNIEATGFFEQPSKKGAAESYLTITLAIVGVLIILMILAYFLLF